MTALCPHCGEALTTYTTKVKTKQSDLEVLVCSHCDKFLGVLGRVEEARRRMEVGEIADLLRASITSEDPGQAHTLRMVAIGEINSNLREVGGDDLSPAIFERILAAVLDGIAEDRREEQARRRERGRDEGRPW